jgi:tetratricopeptide (TPR) repeat protein
MLQIKVILGKNLFRGNTLGSAIKMSLKDLVEAIDRLGLAKDRVDELKKELMDDVFSAEDGSDELLEIDDPTYISETYLLEKEGGNVSLTCGDLELKDGRYSEFCILMDVVAGPDGEERCKGLEVVYSKVLDAEPELSLERAKVEVSILRTLCEGLGFKVTSTTSGLMPIDLSRELVTPKTMQFYKDIQFASNQAIERDLLDADAWRRKASALYFFGELDQAEEALHKALVLGPPVAWPFTALGYIHLHRGNEALARYLFKKGQEALSRMPLLREPLAVMDIVHPRGRPRKGKNVKGDWFEEDLCPNCDRRSWNNIDGVKGICPKCGYQHFRKDVEVQFDVVPKRFFYRVGEPIVLEVHVGNSLGLDIEVCESEGMIQLSSRGKDGSSGFEGLETNSALDRDVIPAKTRFSTELRLDEAIPPEADFWRTLAEGGLLDIYGAFSGRIKDPPSKEYRKVEVFGASTGNYTVEVLDLKGP